MSFVISCGLKYPGSLLLMLLGGCGGRGGRAWQTKLALTGLTSGDWHLSGACKYMGFQAMLGNCAQPSKSAKSVTELSCLALARYPLHAVTTAARQPPAGMV